MNNYLDLNPSNICLVYIYGTINRNKEYHLLTKLFFNIFIKIKIYNFFVCFVFVWLLCVQFVLFVLFALFVSVYIILSDTACTGYYDYLIFHSFFDTKIKRILYRFY